MISVADAIQRIANSTRRLPTLRLPLADCTGLVLAEPAKAGCDSPPFDKAMMDGFAVQTPVTDGSSSDGATSDEAMMFAVTETITAGTVPQKALRAGLAARIMTGAPMPVGGNCVIPIERVTLHSDDRVQISAADVIPEKHVLRQASIAQQGDELFPEGTLLEAQHIAALAEFGNSQVPCVPRPRVAVLATGDELVDVSQPLQPGLIRNSNEPMLMSQVQRAGCDGKGLGIARDSLNDLKSKISEGLQHDVLLLSGGVSAGSLDLVPQVLNSLGVNQVFHKVAVKPGKPIWFGQLDTADRRCLVFGLPGNPVSSMVCFEVFVRPALAKLAGRTPEARRLQKAELLNDVHAKGDRVIYFPAVIRHDGDHCQAEPLPWAGSADLRTTARATGLMVLDPALGPFPQGSAVDCLLW